MWTKKILAAAIAVGFGWAIGSAAPAAAGEKVEWNVSLWGNKRAASAHIESLATMVAERTGGDFTIKIHYGGALSAPKENIDGLKIGAFEAALVCGFYSPGKLPASMALVLPFLPINSLDAQEKVHEVFFAHPALVREFAGWNARVVSPTVLPDYKVMGKGEPPVTMEGWKGMRVRAGGGQGQAVAKLGAIPTSMPSSEIFTGMERGLLDAVALPFSYGFSAFRVDELSSWYIDNLSLGGVNCPLTSSTTAWNALPAEYQKLIDELRPKALAAQKASHQEADDKNVPMFAQKGIKAIKLSDDVLAEIARIGGTPVWEEWIADAESKGIPGRELLDLILATAKSSS